MMPSESDSKPKISLCMITKNEEEFLPQCLASVQAIVHEIIIVDTGSTDRTVDIAETYGAKVYRHPWQDNFSKHRNQSISHATGEWILIMDADEVIAKRDLAKIQKLLKTVPADGFFFTLRNYENTSTLANLTLNPKDYEEGMGFPGFIACDLIRLFKNDPGIYFDGQVHETVTKSISKSKRTTFNTNIPIHHYGKVRSDRIQRKQDSYLALGRKRLNENPSDPMAYKGLSDQLLELGMPPEALDIADRGLIVFPEMLDLHFNRGLALDRLNRPQEAKQEYQWVLAKHPGHLGACHNLGQIFFKDRQFEKTIGLLNQGLAQGLGHPAVLLLLGRAYDAVGHWQNALGCFDRILEIQPDYPDINCYKAVILLNNNRYEAALSVLEKEIAIGGNLIFAYHTLAKVSLALKDLNSAGQFFKKVLSLDPRHAEARSQLQQLEAAGTAI